MEVYPFDTQSYDSYRYSMTADLNYRPRTLAEVAEDPHSIYPTSDDYRSESTPDCNEEMEKKKGKPPVP